MFRDQLIVQEVSGCMCLKCCLGGNLRPRVSVCRAASSVRAGVGHLVCDGKRGVKMVLFETGGSAKPT